MGFDIGFDGGNFLGLVVSVGRFVYLLAETIIEEEVIMGQEFGERELVICFDFHIDLSLVYMS
jgi:hypothetical protein